MNRGDRRVLAQRNYQEALSAFNADKTPKHAEAVQQAAQIMLQAFQASRPAGRPSPEYEALVNKTVAELETVKDAAAAFVTPAEAAAKSLESSDAEIKRLTDANKALRETADRNVKAIEQRRDAKIAETRETERLNVIAINEAADRARDDINAWLAEIMGKITQARYSLLLCPVCFFPDLEEPPREFSICPCCGTEFGVDDYSPRGISPDVIHRELRWEWLERGAPWFDAETPRPTGWSGFEQVWNSPYWLRNAVSTAAPTLHTTVNPKGYIVDARVLTYA